MKKLLSAVTSIVMSVSLMTGAFASSVSAAGSITVTQPNVSMGEVLDVSANKTATVGSVEWLIPSVVAAPGQTVTLPVIAKNSTLAVAGAQFNIDAASPIEYKAIAGGDAYTSDIASNSKGNKFLFNDKSGIEKVAAEGATVFTLSYTVPENCPEGKYDVKWSNADISDTDGFDITKNVKFTDGTITVSKTAAENAVEWIIPTVVAAPGQTVTLPVTVKNSTLAVAGAQFNIDAASPIEYKAIAGGDAYTDNIGTNPAGNKFLFNNKNGVQKVAAEDSTVFTISFTVPENCKEGTYDVKWSNAEVSDTDGFDITKSVKLVDGAIKVDKAAEENAVEWIIPTVVAAPGQTISLPVIVKNSTLAVAGAQFNIDAASPIKYKSVTGGDAYTTNIGSNANGNMFLFNGKDGVQKVAPEGSTVFTIAYTVPSDCAEGTYAVKWSNANVSDTDGFDITKSVKLTDGAIKVVKESSEGNIQWVIDNVEAAPGETVTLKAYVSNPDDVALAVAGAQYKINAETPIEYKSMKTGGAYGQPISENSVLKSFLFNHSAGTGVVAANNATIMTLTYTVPENCDPGVYSVKWSDTFVSDTDGFDLTSRIKFVDGSITVKESVSGQIKWVIDNVKASRGETVTLNVVVEDPKSTKLSVAGAQFFIKADSPIKYEEAMSGTAYNASFSANDEKNLYMFRSTTGKGSVAADNSKLMTLTYTVPTDCPNGVYPVKWSDVFVSDADGFSLTENIIFVDGSISIGDAAEGSVEWVIPTVQGEKGKDATLLVKVKGDADLPVAGAQFVIDNDKAVKYVSGSGKPYGTDLVANDDKQIFKFTQVSGKGKSAKDGDDLFTLTFSVPEDIADGIYPISWAKQFVSDEDGFDITPNVKFVDGAIIIGSVTTTTTTTVTTTTTTTTSATTTSTTLPTPEGGIKWVIDTVEAAPGETVKLNIVVDDAKNAALAIAGAQFKITNPAEVVYNAISGSDAYGRKISFNDDKQIFLMVSDSGKGTAAKDKAIVGTLTYTVPENCPDGIYPVEFSKGTLEIFDADGFSLTDKIVGQNGAIIVKRPVTTESITTTKAPFTSSTTTTSVTTSDKTTEGTTTTVTTSDVTTEGTTTTVTTSDVTTTEGTTTTVTTSDVTTTEGTTTTVTSSDKTTEGTTTTVTSSDETTTEGTTTTVTSSDETTTEGTTTNGDTTTVSTTTVSGPTTSTTTVTVPKDSIAWEVEKVTAYPGQDVVVKVKVKDPRNTQLAIAGAEFNMVAGNGASLVKAGNKSAYGADIRQNEDTLKFMFISGTGKGYVAPDGSVVVELTYKVDANATPGTIIPISIADMFITDQDGFDITNLVLTVDGSITVVEPDETTPTTIETSVTTEPIETTTVTTEEPIENSSTSTTTVDTTIVTSSDETTTEGTTTTTVTTSDVTTEGTTTTVTTSDVTTEGTTTTVTSSDKTTEGTTTTVTSSDKTTEGTTITVTTSDVTTTEGTTTNGDTTTVSTTTVSGPTTSTTTVTVPKDSIAWEVEKVTAYPGQDVVVKVKVKDPRNTQLAIAGAEFNMVAGNGASLVKAGNKSAYGADIRQNEDKLKFMFISGTGKGYVAPDGSVVVELTYKVDANATPGTIIPISIADMFITDEDGFDITNLVLTVDGSITVVEPDETTPTTIETSVTTEPIETTTVTTEEPIENSSTSTTTVDTTIVTSSDETTTEGTTTTVTTSDVTTEGTTTTVTSSGEKTTEGTTSTVTTTVDTTTEGTTSTSTSTVTTAETSSTTTTTINTTQMPIDISSTTISGTIDGDERTRTTSTVTTTVDTTTSTETTSTSTVTTSTNTTTSTVTTTANGYKYSYAVMDTQVGYYFSHDDGRRADGQTGGFNKAQVKTLKIVDVYEDGSEVERSAIDMSLINFNGETPMSIYNSRTHAPKKTTIDDFKYDVPVYYEGMALTDKDGNALTVTAYIGVKGDATLDNMVDAIDASAVLRYYASLSTNDRTPYDVVLQNTAAGLNVSSPRDELDELAAFLADVTENEWGEDNWNKNKGDRHVDASDASNILSFYARSSSSDNNDKSAYEIWNEVLGSRRFGA